MKKPPAMNANLKRRELVKGMGLAALIPLLGGNLLACSDSSDRDTAIKTVSADFLHGVASGDPLQDRVILWTRATPVEEGTVAIEWEVATDEGFTDVVASGSGTTTAVVDYTVKVDAEGLSAGSDYFFRFKSGTTISPIGRTRTAIVNAATSASFAVVSCSNYPAGFFNVYREVANRDVDAVLHLGDYLYEYPADGYASERAEEFGRVVTPATALIALDDYRQRYAQYHTDSDLQACHARHPFIIVWDDHEVADNTWKDGAANHDPATEGDFGERRAAAIQAWYEWLPVRPPSDVKDIIYRQFHYGQLMDLLMLDTRVIGRSQQLDYADFVDGDVIDTNKVNAAVTDSARTMLGDEQFQWLEEKLINSTARWQVLGQQVIMARQALPEAAVRALTPALADENALEGATAAILGAVAAKNKPEEDRTDAEQALLDSAIPFNLDAWDGYSFERDRLLDLAAQIDSRLVVLAGDTHNAWASQLTTAEGRLVGVEFAAPSVTSPGAEVLIGADVATAFGSFAVTLMDDLQYANLLGRGYVALSLTQDEVAAEWVYVNKIDASDYSVDTASSYQLKASRDSLNLQMA